MSHYDKAKIGDWTWEDGFTARPFVFRKGSSCDPEFAEERKEFLESQKWYAEARSQASSSADFNSIGYTSEWITLNPFMANLICDLLNAHEAKQKE